MPILLDTAYESLKPTNHAMTSRDGATVYSDKLDLHGQTWREALSTFVNFYNDAIESSGGSGRGLLDVVHGYGSSGTRAVLGNRLRKFLEGHSDRLDFTPGEAIDGNPGHTLVFPVKPLPDATSLLAESILIYCVRPKAQSKIMGKFRRHGQPNVLAAIRFLASHGHLQLTRKGAHRLYEAV